MTEKEKRKQGTRENGEKIDEVKAMSWWRRNKQMEGERAGRCIR